MDLAEDDDPVLRARAGRDIAIEIIGRRPGEKLHEQLFNAYERPEPTPAQKIMRAARPAVDPAWVEYVFDKVGLLVAEGDAAGLAAAVAELAGGRTAVVEASADRPGATGLLDSPARLHGAARVLAPGPGRQVRRLRRDRRVLRTGRSHPAVLRPGARSQTPARMGGPCARARGGARAGRRTSTPRRCAAARRRRSRAAAGAPQPVQRSPSPPTASSSSSPRRSPRWRSRAPRACTSRTCPRRIRPVAAVAAPPTEVGRRRRRRRRAGRARGRAGRSTAAAPAIAPRPAPATPAARRVEPPPPPPLPPRRAAAAAAGRRPTTAPPPREANARAVIITAIVGVLVLVGARLRLHAAGGGEDDPGRSPNVVATPTPTPTAARTTGHDRHAGAGVDQGERARSASTTPRAQAGLAGTQQGRCCGRGLSGRQHRHGQRSASISARPRS